MKRGRGATNLWFNFANDADSGACPPPATQLTKTEKLQKVLQQGGNGDYYTHSLVRNVAFTDGVKRMADIAGAYWLIDAVVSYLTGMLHEEFQVWTLTVAERVATLTCDDGNGNILVTQSIKYTDFPVDEIVLYLEHGSLGMVNWCWILMLPTER